MATNTSSITINASAEKIWDAITKPALVKQWQYGSDLLTDWTSGSDIRFSTEWEGAVYEQWGKVLEVIPYRLLRYRLFAPRPGLEDKPENYFEMRYVLHEAPGGSRLDIIQEDNRPGAIQEAVDEAENPMLAALKALVES